MCFTSETCSDGLLLPCRGAAALAPPQAAAPGKGLSRPQPDVATYFIIGIRNIKTTDCSFVAATLSLFGKGVQTARRHCFAVAAQG